MKTKGPTIDPGGTQKRFPSMNYNQNLLLFFFSVSKLTIYHSARLKPCTCSFVSKSLWERESKALDKSVKSAPKYSSLSTADLHFSNMD